jgi:hypothetical protein
VLGAYVVLLILLAIPSIPIYYYVDPAYKLLVIRICGGVLLAFSLHHMHKTVREQLEQQPASRFEAVVSVPLPGISLAPQFDKLRNEVHNSLRSRSYFEHILRLRLLRLLERRVRARYGSGVTELAEHSVAVMEPKLLDAMVGKGPRRVVRRWGISLRELRGLVQRLEEL